MDIVAPHKMSKEDIERSVDDAKRYEEEDKKIRERVETRNSAESLVYTADKTLEEYKDKIPKDVYDKIESAKKELDESVKKEDYEGMKSKMEDLKKALEEVGSSIYKGGPQGSGEGQGAGGGTGTDEDTGQGGTTDADFKVEK